MRLNVVFTVQAEDDLQSILDFIAAESPARAERIVDDIEGKALDLGETHHRYALLVRHKESGIRRRVVGSYNIYYRTTGQQVEVLHILHGARDAEQLLFSTDNEHDD